MPGIERPQFPTIMTAGDLDFSELMDVMIADSVYFALGDYVDDGAAAVFGDLSKAAEELENSYIRLGELAEKPGKMDSKINKLKTRNFSIPGKRTSTVELNIAGLSNNQKNYLESVLFQGKVISILVASKDLRRIVLFNGMRWTVDWSGEADGLFNVVISTEFSGATADRIQLFKDIPDALAN